MVQSVWNLTSDSNNTGERTSNGGLRQTIRARHDRRRAEAGVIDQGSARLYAAGLQLHGLRRRDYRRGRLSDLAMFAVVDTGAGLQLTSFGSFIFASAFKWVVIFAPLGMVFFLSARINSMSLSGAQIAFWVFAALMGLSIASIFLVYAHASIARVFFITAASFGALSLYGYTTQA